MAVAESTVQEQLAWEARTRPRAAVIAVLAGVLIIGGLIVGGSTSSERPSALFLDSLQALEREGPIGEQPTAHIADFEWAADHTGSILASVILVGLGLVAVGLSYSFLARATRARRPALPRLALPAAAVGATLLALSLVTVSFAQIGWHDDVLGGARTVDAVRERPTLEGVGYAMQVLGQLVFAIGAVIVALNAMRAGLLTRTMGILGMFAGGGVIFFGPAAPLLPLWTIFLAPLFLGRWMGGMPPAWSTGKEEPWPSAAALREERLRERGQLAEPDPEPVEEAAAARAPHPSSKKRKRKRRT